MAKEGRDVMLKLAVAAQLPLIEISTRAGHGGGKPTSKKIAETADLWTFLVKNLGMKIEATPPPSSRPGSR